MAYVLETVAALIGFLLILFLVVLAVGQMSSHDKSERTKRTLESMMHANIPALYLSASVLVSRKSSWLQNYAPHNGQLATLMLDKGRLSLSTQNEALFNVEMSDIAKVSLTMWASTLRIELVNGRHYTLDMSNEDIKMAIANNHIRANWNIVQSLVDIPNTDKIRDFWITAIKLSQEHSMREIATPSKHTNH